MRGFIFVLIAVMAALLAAACGGSGDEASPAPDTVTTPTLTRGQIAPSGRCRPSGEPRPSYNVQLTAQWKGKDSIVIEGTAKLPGPGTVNYFICQDGNVTPSLRWAREPTFEGGKIRAESKVVESPVGPAFDPDAQFDVVLSILGLPVQVPYFTVRVPVQGEPQ